MRGHWIWVGVVMAFGPLVVSCQATPPTPSATALASVGLDQPSHLYCRFLAGGSPALPALDAEPSPASVRVFWDARRAFEHRASIAAPAEIAADWATVAAFTRDELTPAIEAMGYVTIPVIAEPAAVAEARVRIAMVDAGCDSPSA